MRIGDVGEMEKTTRRANNVASKISESVISFSSY